MKNSSANRQNELVYRNTLVVQFGVYISTKNNKLKLINFSFPWKIDDILDEVILTQI